MFKEVVLVALVLTCAYTDLSKRLIYNAVLLPAAFFGLIYAVLAGGPTGLWQSMSGLLIGFSLLFVPFYFGGLGAGDVKMLAVIGAIQGPLFTFQVFLISAVVGGIWALVFMIRQGVLLRTVYVLLINFNLLRKGLPAAWTAKGINDTRPEETLPYGTVLALGTLLTLLSRWFGWHA